MQPPEPCVACGCVTYDDEGGFGLSFCLGCGTGRRSIARTYDAFVEQERIPGHQSYTRLKRFKKYLCRAMRQQSSSTIPRETWDYLLARAPYNGSKHIQMTLKRARNLRRKCYDSLPFLTAALCPNVSVPCISLYEKKKAIDLFRKIDAAVRTGPFVSYLFCLEYILKKIGRRDMVEYINRIQCPRRREKYTLFLDDVFTPYRAPDGSLGAPGPVLHEIYSKWRVAASSSSAAPERTPPPQCSPPTLPGAGSAQ